MLPHEVQHSATSRGGDHAHQVRRQGSRQRPGPVTDPDDLGWLRPWCTLVHDATTAGKAFRRARVVSEPLSDYQRWAQSLTAPMVDAGEDIRWVPRARVSELMFPGNDFWLFDDDLLVFMVFAGNGP